MNREQAIATAPLFRVGHVTIEFPSGKATSHVTHGSSVRPYSHRAHIGQPSITAAKHYVRDSHKVCVAERYGENLLAVMNKRIKAYEAEQKRLAAEKLAAQAAQEAASAVKP